MSELTLEQVKRVLSLVGTVVDCPEKHEPAEFLHQIGQLGQILALLVRDELSSMGQDSGIKQLIENTLGSCFRNESLRVPERERHVLYTRLFRGLILLVRNFAGVGLKVDMKVVLSSFHRFQKVESLDNPFYSKTVLAYLQLLANLSQSTQGKDSQTFLMRDEILESDQLMTAIEGDEEMKLAFLVCLDSSFRVEEFVNDNVMSFLLNQALQADLEAEELGPYRTRLVLTLQSLVSHERYFGWIKEYMGDLGYLAQVVRVDQLVITCKEDWNNHQLTSLLVWLFELFKLIATEAKQELIIQSDDYTRLQHLHQIITSLLDCFSYLCKFDVVVKYLQYYQAIEPLIELLRVVQENTERKTMKVSEIKQQDEDKKPFPQVKSLIIEIIAYLLHNSPDTQEQVRVLHGLELILSNCLIDDNEPYIKERAIVCLKFLLANNKKNQDFVAKLEAKKVYDDEALKEVGYEVQIKDGNVDLKKRN